MVAFKEEFPYLRCDSGQLFEFDRDWLHAAINRAADKAGYPSWWLTEHVTESIAFYLHRSEEHTSELQSLRHLVCRLLLEKKKPKTTLSTHTRPHVVSFNSS